MSRRPRAGGNGDSIALLLPAAVCIGVFYLLPEVLNTIMAFTDWSIFTRDTQFIGIGNFTDLGMGRLSDTISVTIRFALLGVLLTNLLALGLALALERPTRLHAGLTAIFFIPVLISALSAGYVWRALLDPAGVVNSSLSAFLGLFGAGPVDTAWLGSTDWTIYVLSFIFAWKTFGIALLIYAAGLVSIPGEVTEAAKIDGAGTWTLVRRVKLPLLGPAFTASIILTLTSALTSFDIVVATTNGGPGGSTSIFNMLIFKLLGQGTLGQAAAVGLILMILVALASIPTLIRLRRREVSL